MLFKIKGQDLESVSASTLQELKLKEQSLEDWVERKPELVGEPLLVIGRQVQVSGMDNRLDLLALDREGKLVVIEVKRDLLDVPVEFQALRYTSALASWSYESIKAQTEGYLREKNPGTEVQFQEVLDGFFEGEVDLNEDQRIILVGRTVHERLLGVAKWLLAHGVDVKVIEVSLFVDSGAVFLSPKVVVQRETGERGTEQPAGKPWEVDGRKWHLEERCSAKTAPLMQALADVIQQSVVVEQLSWGQKHYVAFRLHGRNWVGVETRPNSLILNFDTAAGSFAADEVAKLLGIVVFDHQKTLADKLGTPSSVDIEHLEGRDRVHLRLKPPFEFDRKEFVEFIRRAHKAALT